MFSNRPGTKLFTAFVLLGGAIALAFSFRRDPSQPIGSPMAKAEAPILRATPPPADIRIVRPDAPTAEIQPTLLAPPSRALDAPDRTDTEFARLAPPPMMARTYPDWPPRSSLGASTDPQIVADDERGPLERVHKVRDGDTLETLAERYLGDRSRWREIYQRNAGAIERPDLLPLGARLRIPPKYPLPPQRQAGLEPLPISQGPLVSLSSEAAP